jgi:hypothetical protein
MRLRPIGGELQHVDAGTVIKITRHDLAGLSGDDYTLAPARRRKTVSR